MTARIPLVIVNGVPGQLPPGDTVTIQQASTSVSGIIKVDGTTIIISGGGVVSVAAPANTNVEYSSYGGV